MNTNTSENRLLNKLTIGSKIFIFILRNSPTMCDYSYLF
jgi:hypothetical protein